MFEHWLMRPIRNSFMLALPVLLSACATQVIDRDAAENGGFWEQDENTDPRFRHAQVQGAVIGGLHVDGPNVFLNGERVTRSAQVPDRATLVTGANSGARIDFVGGGGGCAVVISEFRVGTGFGSTGNCRHRMQTDSNVWETGGGATEYNVRTGGGGSRMTVFKGVMYGWPGGGSPEQRVAVRAGWEVEVARESMGRPYRLPPGELESRQRWRQNFRFVDRTVNWAALAGIAVVGGIAVIAGSRDRDDDDRPQLAPATGTTTSPLRSRAEVADSTTRVPALTNMTRDAAAAALERAGLRLGQVSGYGLVVAQNPAPRTTARRGASVSISLRPIN